MQKQYLIVAEAELRHALKSKRERDRLSLREAARLIGLSSQSILHRIEAGHRFDYSTGLKILNWLQPAGAKPDTIAIVNAAIFADSALSERQARLISSLFADMYDFAIASSGE